MKPEHLTLFDDLSPKWFWFKIKWFLILIFSKKNDFDFDFDFQLSRKVILILISNHLKNDFVIAWFEETWSPMAVSECYKFQVHRLKPTKDYVEMSSILGHSHVGQDSVIVRMLVVHYSLFFLPQFPISPCPSSQFTESESLLRLKTYDRGSPAGGHKWNTDSEVKLLVYKDGGYVNTCKNATGRGCSTTIVFILPEFPSK